VESVDRQAESQSELSLRPREKEGVTAVDAGTGVFDGPKYLALPNIGDLIAWLATHKAPRVIMKDFLDARA
jgi:hypothetical protein